jgi:hypothetical protein
VIVVHRWIALQRIHYYLIWKLAVKGQHSTQQVIQNHAQTEIIHSLVVILALNYLGRNVIWSAYKPFPLWNLFQHNFIDCKPQVNDLHFVDSVAII